MFSQSLTAAVIQAALQSFSPLFSPFFLAVKQAEYLLKKGNISVQKIFLNRRFFTIE